MNYSYFLNLLRDLALSWNQWSSVVINSWKLKKNIFTLNIQFFKRYIPFDQ